MSSEYTAIPVETRLLEIYKNVRCLDCDNANSGVETAESPLARDVREMTRTLVRKGKTDLEIYREMSDVFGRHAIISINIMDGKEQITDPVSNMVLKGAGIFAATCFGLLIWKARKGRKL